VIVQASIIASIMQDRSQIVVDGIYRGPNGKPVRVVRIDPSGDGLFPDSAVISYEPDGPADAGMGRCPVTRLEPLDIRIVSDLYRFGRC
jgi:hypothetical protein